MTGSGSAAIVIVNWNGWQDTLACIQSCKAQEYPDFRIIVVDNGSADDSLGRIRDAFPEVRLIGTGANLGFAGGNNVGIRVALDEGAAYVWLLNNDTVIEPGALAALVEACAADPLVGAAGSKITYYDRQDVLWYAGGEITKEGHTRHRGLDEPDRGLYDVTEETDFITGCSLLVTAEAFEQVGLMNEQYFLYWEETELDWRMRAAGFKLMYVPQSVVRHKVAGSLGESWEERQTEYLVRNMLLFHQRNIPDRLPAVYARAVRDGFWHLAHRRFNYARATFSGIWRFSIGSFGPIVPRS